MKRFPYLSPRAQWCAAILILLAVVPRLVGLEHRPLMHDESLFAYYSYSTMTSGQYIHIPMLHGPTLMLVTAKLFKIFGDTITTGRMFVAIVSLFGMAAGIALWPRRYRYWLAPLLITSPILLFYSRFFRDDMLVSTAYLLATLGVALALWPGARWRPFWAAVGAFFSIIPLALMESALFFQAAAITFFVVWMANRLLWPGWSPTLRPRPRTPLRRYTPEGEPAGAARSGSRRRNKGGSQAQNAATTATLPQTEPEFQPAWPPAIERPRPGGLALFLGWGIGILLGIAFVMYVYGITYDFSQMPERFLPLGSLKARLAAPLLNMKASWDYWKDQHMQHRIEGPLHYHLPILLTYELPILLAIAVGLAWDAVQRRRRAISYGVALVLWLWAWALWRWTSYVKFWDFDPIRNLHAPPPFLKPFTDFLHVQPDLSMLVLGLMITPLLVWSVLQLREHRVLASWLGWWAACSLFQYSSAGEKVPWLAIHIDLPLYMTLGWLWAPKLRRMGRRGLATAAALMLATTVIALRNDIHLIGDRAADPRERVIFNHTPPNFDLFCRSRLAAWADPKYRIPLKERNVIMVDQPGWPGVWYFRHTTYRLDSTTPINLEPTTDLVIGNKELMEPLVARIDQRQWRVIDIFPENSTTQLSLRNHWMAPWPEKAYLQEGQSSLGALWDYYWFRKTWTEPGNFPLTAIEPVKVRQQ